MSEEIKENAIEHAEEGNPAFGRTRGVLSGVVNQVSSGSIIVTAVAAIASITGSENLGVMILIVLGALLMFAVLVPDPEYISGGYPQSLSGGDEL